MGKVPVILYFGDYDPSGEDIPRSIKATLLRMGVDVEVRRIALMKEQVIERNLPPAPAKSGDSRTSNWDGLGQVELDAIEPSELVEMVEEAIAGVFDEGLYSELMTQQMEEKPVYMKQLRTEINEFFDENK